MKKFVILIIIIFFGILIYFFARDKENEKDYLLLSGNIEAREVNLSFKVFGKIKELNFEEGERVKEMDTLGKIEAEEIENELELQKEILEEANIKLQELKKGSREQEIKDGEANLNAKEVEMEKAKKDFLRAEFLYKNEAISQSKYEEYKKIMEIAEANYKRALENLNLIKEGPRKEEILQQEKRIKQIETSIKIAEEKLKDTILYSPINGIVLSKNLAVGEISNPSIPVYTIGELDKPYVKVYVKESKIGFLKIGQNAEVYSDSFPDKKYNGKITYISSQAEFTPKNIQTKEERTKLVFEVKVDVLQENEELKPGMPVDVRIKLK